MGVLSIAVLVALINTGLSIDDEFLYGKFPPVFTWSMSSGVYSPEPSWNQSGNNANELLMGTYISVSCYLCIINLNILCYVLALVSSCPSACCLGLYFSAILSNLHSTFILLNEKMLCRIPSMLVLNLSNQDRRTEDLVLIRD